MTASILKLWFRESFNFRFFHASERFFSRINQKSENDEAIFW